MRGSRRQIVAVAAVLGLTAALAGVPDPGAAEAETIERLVAGPRDFCAVCGMLVAAHPQWIAKVERQDGSEVFFDGPKDLFRWLLRTRDDAAPDDGERTEVRVTSSYDGAALDGRPAFYVVGSDVRGPMGAELVPHPTLEDARAFVADHGGEIVRFGDVTRQLLDRLDGR